jgi:D-threo-aldose 1-dehydrogenase
MRSTPLGRTSTRVSELSRGAAPLGNLFRAVSDEDAAATVDAAWDAGIRTFDTAPHYGLGLSERRLGAALRGRPRDQYTLSTKVGRLLRPAVDSRGDDLANGFAVPATQERVWDFSARGVRTGSTSSTCTTPTTTRSRPSPAPTRSWSACGRRERSVRSVPA